MKTASSTLHDFWFEPTPPARLAMLRILIGMFTVWYIGSEQDDLVKVAATDPRLFAPVGVVFGAPLGPVLFHWLYLATLVGTICFTLGLWFRITGPVFAALLLWLLCYRNSWSMIYHSDNLLALHVIVLALARSADVLSLDSFLRGLRQPGSAPSREPGWQYGWPIKLVIALTVSTYFISAVCKLAGPLGLSWITGRNLRAQMAVDGLRKELLGVDPNPVAYALYEWLPLFTLLAAGSFMLEFFAPVALLNKRVGRLWAINALMFHWGIFFVMGITFRYQLSAIIFAPFFRLERILDVTGKLWSKLGGRPAAEPEQLHGEVLIHSRQCKAVDDLGHAQTNDPPPHVAGIEIRPAVAAPAAPHATLYYDGECGLCDRFVQFVIRHDRREHFQFATLQSEAGRAVLSPLKLPETDLQTVVLVEAGRTHVRSSATLRVCSQLGGLWPLLYGFMLVPRPLRDAVYSLVVRNRKLWFKPPETCPVMPPELRRRFVG